MDWCYGPGGHIVNTTGGLLPQGFVHNAVISPPMAWPDEALDGAVFYDSHRGEGQPASFHVGAVIPGMGEALQQMREGDQWRLFVPSDLAYRERGPLADRTLVFELELVSVEGVASPGPPTDSHAGDNP